MGLLFAILFCFPALSQQNQTNTKGRFFLCWGWNRSTYTKSNIHFKGNGYDFTLYDVAAKDRQSPLGIDPYFHPTKITIPQVNYVFGYCLKNNYTISFSVDHMKYVVVENQIATISGEISESKFAGNYQHNPILISPDFLEFEHTDGLNYIHLEITRINTLSQAKKWGTISFTKGISFGALYPRSDITLLGRDNHDKFNITGYGTAVKIGTRFELWKKIFITNEIKGGFIHMPNIPTSSIKGEIASQHFYFFQTNVILGFFLNFKKKNPNNVEKK